MIHYFFCYKFVDKQLFYKKKPLILYIIGDNTMIQNIFNYKGLNNEEVTESRKKYGNNSISKKNNNSFLHLLLESLGDPIIKILLIALGIKTIVLIKSFDIYETIGIVIAVFIASFISSISEYGSEKAFQKLESDASKTKVKVLRNSKIEEVFVDEIVVGDLVVLTTGDKIPADGIVIEGTISVDESIINGETKEQIKDKSITKNKVFRGTIVYSNEALVKITNVGENTFYGKIAQEIQEKESPSPLKLRLAHLAKIISKIGYIGAILISISYLFSVIVINNNFDYNKIIQTLTNIPLMFGYLLYALTLSVTIIVVAVPEGLPMMITLVLSSNMKRMLKNNVLVRKLVGIETAGSLNILFTDKTGTLTKGNLEVVNIVTPDNKEFDNIISLQQHKSYYELIRKSLIYNNESIYDLNKNKVVSGNITDRALLKYIKGIKDPKVKIIDKITFSSKNKYSITTIEENEKIKLVKGAPEKILKHCNSYYDINLNKKIFKSQKEVEQKINNYLDNGYRLIALATSKNTLNTNNLDNLCYLGLVVIKDEVRKEAIAGLQLVQNSGIQTVMITGDNLKTAISIGKEVGLLKTKDDIVMTSDEINQLNDNQLKKIIPNLKIVARSLPQDKSRLVRISKELNLVVGMTGDGVNDAPALKKADIGFAMGSGTEVAKEASDIVILDDNFLSISKAILYGRTIFKSIRKFIIFQLTVNLCAISISLIGPFLGIYEPVTVIQMLWINMVMDTLAGIAFAYEPPLLEYMQELPKNKNENIVNKYMFNQILITGLYVAFLCLLFLKLPFFKTIYQKESSLMTAFFGLFIFTSLFNSFNARTTRINIFSNLYKNKAFLLVISIVIIIQIYLIYYGGTLFRTTALTIKEFIIMLIISSTVIPFDLIRKTIRKIKHKKSIV